MAENIIEKNYYKPVHTQHLSNQEELIAFCRLIVAASKSGMRFITALEKLSVNINNSQSIIWINELVSKLKAGYSIEEAKNSLKGFDPVLAKLLPLLGNEKLVKVFEIYTKYLIKQETCKKQIRCLVWYPLLVMLFCFIFILYLNFYSFPQMEIMSTIERSFNSWGFYLLYFLNQAFWPFSLIIPGLMGYLIIDCSVYMFTGQFSDFSLWAWISGLNKASEMNEKSRLVALLSLYIQAGYSLNESIAETIPFIGETMAKDLLKTNKSLSSGNHLSEVLLKSDILSDFLNGNESVDEMPEKLQYAYDNYNYETINTLKTVSDKLFYIPLIIAGLMVLLAVTGFFGTYSYFVWSVS